MQTCRGSVIRNYRLTAVLGSGNTSVVWSATHVKLNKQVAIKIIDKKAKDINYEFIDREIKIMRSLKNRYIEQFYESFEDDLNIFIVMEIVQSGSLFDEINFRGRLSEERARKYFIQILSGLSYLHKKNIVHRDIKLENILIDVNGNIRLTDFGLSDDLTNSNSIACGSPAYVAPEVILRSKCDTKIDIWSLGVLLYKMIAGKYPFEDNSIQGLMHKIVKSELETPPDASNELKDLLSKMLIKNPQERISLDSIGVHPWVTTVKMLPSLVTNSKDPFEEVFSAYNCFNSPIKDVHNKLDKGIDDDDTVMFKILMTYYELEKCAKQKMKITSTARTRSTAVSGRQNNGAIPISFSFQIRNNQFKPIPKCFSSVNQKRAIKDTD